MTIMQTQDLEVLQSDSQNKNKEEIHKSILCGVECFWVHCSGTMTD